ncbi:hypothetical protein J6590_044760 [Homalodisca vitripennis]|nr:hypothetical protein J6590_044760 [Homalodisca vitripennis]
MSKIDDRDRPCRDPKRRGTGHYLSNITLEMGKLALLFTFLLVHRLEFDAVTYFNPRIGSLVRPKRSERIDIILLRLQHIVQSR